MIAKIIRMGGPKGQIPRLTSTARLKVSYLSWRIDSKNISLPNPCHKLKRERMKDVIFKIIITVLGGIVYGSYYGILDCRLDNANPESNDPKIKSLNPNKLHKLWLVLMIVLLNASCVRQPATTVIQKGSVIHLTTNEIMQKRTP